MCERFGVEVSVACVCAEGGRGPLVTIYLTGGSDPMVYT